MINLKQMSLQAILPAMVNANDGLMARLSNIPYGSRHYSNCTSPIVDRPSTDFYWLLTTASLCTRDRSYEARSSLETMWLRGLHC